MGPVVHDYCSFEVGWRELIFMTMNDILSIWGTGEHFIELLDKYPDYIILATIVIP